MAVARLLYDQPRKSMIDAPARKGKVLRAFTPPLLWRISFADEQQKKRGVLVGFL